MVKENFLHAKVDDSVSGGSRSSGLQIPSPGNSSHSSIKASNRILKLTKPQNRKVIPSQRPASSDSGSTSSHDSDQDLLPDIYTTIRPEDNDSSDYGLEAGQGEDESIDDDSSAGLSKNPDARHLQSPSPKKKKVKANSNKKSARSANPTANVEAADTKPIINFYPGRGYEEVEEKEDQPQLVYESEKIINRWRQLRANPPLTIVYIEMSRELQTESRAWAKAAKKARARRRGARPAQE